MHEHLTHNAIHAVFAVFTKKLPCLRPAHSGIKWFRLQSCRYFLLTYSNVWDQGSASENKKCQVAKKRPLINCLMQVT